MVLGLGWQVALVRSLWFGRGLWGLGVLVSPRGLGYPARLLGPGCRYRGSWGSLNPQSTHCAIAHSEPGSSTAGIVGKHGHCGISPSTSSWIVVITAFPRLACPLRIQSSNSRLVGRGCMRFFSSVLILTRPARFSLPCSPYTSLTTGKGSSPQGASRLGTPLPCPWTSPDHDQAQSTRSCSKIMHHILQYKETKNPS